LAAASVPNHAPGAAVVLDHQLLAKDLAQLVGPSSADEVGGSAGAQTEAWSLRIGRC
jgi:hypothetical protein